MRLAAFFFLWVAVCPAGCQRPSADAKRAPVDAGAPGKSSATPEQQATLLGGERGLDHVGIALKDLDEATRVFHDSLGFSHPLAGTLPNGIRNTSYYFADGTYLETMAPYDRAKAGWIGDFTEKHQGALFGVLSAYSPEATTAFLATRGVGIASVFSGTVQTAKEATMPEEKWRTFFLPHERLPGDPLFFISYRRDLRDEFLRELKIREVRQSFYHENTALGLRAVWIAVDDLASASVMYTSIGLASGRTFVDAALGANVQVFAAGEGEIWLLAPSSPLSAVAAFLRERGKSSVMGITLATGSVQSAARLIAARSGVATPIYQGGLGTSIRGGPEHAEGAWIEFAQYLVPGTADAAVP